MTVGINDGSSGVALCKVLGSSLVNNIGSIFSAGDASEVRSFVDESSTLYDCQLDSLSDLIIKITHLGVGSRDGMDPESSAEVDDTELVWMNVGKPILAAGPGAIIGNVAAGERITLDSIEMVENRGMAIRVVGAKPRDVASGRGGVRTQIAR